MTPFGGSRAASPFSEIGDQVVKMLGYHLTTIPREWSAQWLSLLGRLINSSKIAT
jgi:hypothetical protein